MLLRPVGLERKQSGQGLRRKKDCFRRNQGGLRALLGISGPFCPRGRHLEALPRGALFLCLAGCSESLLRDRRTKLSQVSPLAELALWTPARLALSWYSA